MKKAGNVLVACLRDGSGQNVLEYALVAGLIGLGAIAAMSGMAGTVGNIFGSIGNGLANSV